MTWLAHYWPALLIAWAPASVVGAVLFARIIREPRQ